MKKLILTTVLAIMGIFGAMAQSKTVHLEQTPGEFTVKELKLSEGTYVFEITNSGVNHEVGFVLAPKGKVDKEHFIKEAFVKETVKNGKTQPTSEVTLAKGEYVYFCPLNPTEQYSLTVE